MRLLPSGANSRPPGADGAGSLLSTYRIFGLDVPHLSRGTLLRNDNIPNESWNKSLLVQGQVQRRAVYLTKVALGLTAWKRRDFYAAIERFTDALANTPSDEASSSRAALFLYRGLSFAQQGKFAEATADYKAVLDLDGTQIVAMREMGNAYHAQSLFDKAIQSFTDCIARDQHDALAFDGRGLAYLRRGTADESQRDEASRRRDLADAKTDIEQAIDIDPKLAAAYNHRGLLSFAQGPPESALPDLIKAVTLDPKYTDAFNHLGRVYTTLKKYDEAILAYTKAKEVATPPVATVADAGRGTAFLAKQEYALAIADFTTVLNCRPTATQLCDASPVAILEARASAYDRSKRYDDAVADFAQALWREKEPRQIALLRYNIGHVLNEKRDTAEAFSNLSQALVLDPNLDVAYYERADVRKQQMDITGAMTDLEQFLKLTTDNNARVAANYRLNELKKISTSAK